MIQEDRALANAFNLSNVVAHQDYGPTIAIDQVFHSVEALALKGKVADRQDFVDDQDLGLNTCGDGEPEAHLHA